MITISTYFFLLLILLNAIAKSRKINWGGKGGGGGEKEQRNVKNFIFSKILRYYKDLNLLIGKSAITELHELKNISITVFKFSNANFSHL